MEPLEILDNYTKILEHRSKAYSVRNSEKIQPKEDLD